MKRIRTKIPNWALGFGLTIFILIVYLTSWYPFEVLEYITYDFRAQLRQKPTDNKVVIVAIDEESISKIGRWPWPRAYIGESINILKEYGVSVIGISVLYSEKDDNTALNGISAVIEKLKTEEALIKSNNTVKEIFDSLTELEQILNNDAIFAESIWTATNVILPVYFELGEPMVDDDKAILPSYLTKNSISAPKGDNSKRALNILMPIKEFAENSLALGHINIDTDVDGVLRSEPLLINYKGNLYPSFALQMAIKQLKVDSKDIKVASDGITVAKLKVPTDDKHRLLISYNGKFKTFQYYSFFDLINGKLQPQIFKDKVVILGPVAAGVATLSITPLGSHFGVEITANVIDNIISGNHIMRPWWAFYMEILVILLFGLYLSFLIPKLKGRHSAFISIVLILVWNGAGIYFFMENGLWLKIFYPDILIVLGYTVVVTKKYFLSEKQTEAMEADSIETNKMLGLSFQGQGMLDMAFDKFRKCPIEDESIKEVLYNLGLDFERKRQFNKATAVYEHILSAGPYKELEEKVRKLKTAGETVVIGGSGRKESTVLMEANETRPTLGRYEVLKELGRGAMGIVYLGKDPKINRDVAIKTLRYEEIDDEQLREIKERFFREAEAAGKLNHPNIVKIFDVGEDQEIAYMAMELLHGTDLIKFCSKNTRLSFGEILKVVSSVADALNYAHKNGVVHRDIKPANIMLLDNKDIRVTDFGIARVMESSKTQTGAVLGTPSYMSPEQIAGKKVDGRTDLFSLGVVFFELLCGEKPFKGDSIATLMYNITSADRPNVKDYESKVPKCIADIINKLLVKDADTRFQTGEEFINALNRCKREILLKRPPTQK
ncbi:MAG: serine/threonine-protein kinase [Candidatus Magnetoovum sp. WYHC-5]|nr:serine/threonine-protein kinase [Candidatus Magnetoovum sp. WYHC-5]